MMDHARLQDRPDAPRNANPRGYEESIGRPPKEVVGGYYDLEEGRVRAFYRSIDRLRSPWGAIVFAGLAASLFLAGVLGAALLAWSQGEIVGSTIGLVIVVSVVVVSGHWGSRPGGPRG